MSGLFLVMFLFLKGAIRFLRALFNFWRRRRLKWFHGIWGWMVGDWRLEIDDGLLTCRFGGRGVGWFKIDLSILSFLVDSRYNSGVIFDWIIPISCVSSGVYFKPANTISNPIFIPMTRDKVILMLHSGIRLFPAARAALALPGDKGMKRLRFRCRACSPSAQCSSLSSRTVGRIGVKNGGVLEKIVAIAVSLVLFLKHNPMRQFYQEVTFQHNS